MILGAVNAVLCGIVLRPLGETAAFRGASYHLPAGAAEDGPRSRNPVWQNYALEYLRSGTAVVIARFSSGGGGFSPETFRVIQSWPEIGRTIVVSFGGRNRDLLRSAPAQSAIEAHVGRCSGSLLAARAGVVVGAQRARAQEIQPLGEQVLQLGDGAALAQHVPVGTGRLLLLQSGTLTVGTQGLGTAARALPQRRDLGFGRED